MSEWIEYTGSDEQIAEIESAFLKSGFIVTKKNGSISEIIQGTQQLAKGFVLYNFEQVWVVKRYLICNPHPLADMICQQAMTGLPVWIKQKHNGEWLDYAIGTSLPKSSEQIVSRMSTTLL